MLKSRRMIAVLGTGVAGTAVEGHFRILDLDALPVFPIVKLQSRLRACLKTSLMAFFVSA